VEEDDGVNRIYNVESDSIVLPLKIGQKVLCYIVIIEFVDRKLYLYRVVDIVKVDSESNYRYTDSNVKCLYLLPY